MKSEYRKEIDDLFKKDVLNATIDYVGDPHLWLSKLISVELNDELFTVSKRALTHDIIEELLEHITEKLMEHRGAGE